ncbi:MAG: hypothetical protein JHC29_04335 [Thermoplasmata archaeon]|jgi:signal recognition particle subunit SEC65|nr:hypothetical protein [Thermoplasmata archaeon]
MIIYTSYFKRTLSRKMGRKVPKSLASDATPEKVEMALKKLNIKYEIQDKKYPKHWYDDKIRFYIETEKNKSYLLKEIAKTIKTI